MIIWICDDFNIKEITERRLFTITNIPSRLNEFHRNYPKIKQKINTKSLIKHPNIRYVYLSHTNFIKSANLVVLCLDYRKDTCFCTKDDIKSKCWPVAIFSLDLIKSIDEIELEKFLEIETLFSMRAATLCRFALASSKQWSFRWMAILNQSIPLDRNGICNGSVIDVELSLHSRKCHKFGPAESKPSTNIGLITLCFPGKLHQHLKLSYFSFVWIFVWHHDE